MLRTFARNNKAFASIVVFLLVFGFIQMLKPSFLYNRAGSLREFGVGYRNKTILPMWLLSIVLGIICYLIVVYYTVHPRLF